MNKQADRIAILGAGGTGVCTALELSQRGYKVDLYDENPEPVSRASFINEGKIHLGFIYAKDSSLRTAGQMITGALHFVDNLRRWIELNPEDLISTPFHYCVHRDSLMDPGELEHHYIQCLEIFERLQNKFQKKYLGLFDKAYVDRMSDSQMSTIVNPEFFEAVFQTSEYGIDPRKIGLKLREALHSDPNIQLISNTRIQSVKNLPSSKLEVKYYSNVNGSGSQKYHTVANATWHGRIPIDKPMGIYPPAKWSHRYKFGNRVSISLDPSVMPSCTCVQGPFGDIVNFRQNGMFLSWYPIGRTGWSEDERPPEWDKMFTDEQRLEVFKDSHEQLKLRFPSLEKLSIDPKQVNPDGGVIYALGSTDVDDDSSKLHDRFEVGIQSRDNYHSIDTGKYTLVPYWGVKLADRLEGIS